METKLSQKEIFDFYNSRPWVKFYPEGVPRDIELPVKSIPQAFDEVAEKWKNKTAIVFYGRKISYLELKDQVDRFATALYDLGIRKGDVVALHLLNSPQWIIALLGACKAGAIISPISPLYVSQEVKHQLEDSGAKTLICLDLLYEAIENTGVDLKNVILTSISEYLPSLQKVMGKSVIRAVYQKRELPSPKIYEREGFYQFQDLIKKYPPNPPKIEFDPKEDVVMLPYSGGTTGWPKGAMLTHYSLLANHTQMWAILSPPLEESKEVIMAYLPFYHIGGVLFIMMGLMKGLNQVIFTSPDLDDIISGVRAYNAKLFAGTPTLFDMLRDYKKTGRVDWKGLKWILCAADALLDETRREFEERTGGTIYEMWGMTEVCGDVNFNPYGKRRIGSCGCPYPNVEEAVINPETLDYVHPGEIGELIVTCPSLLKGYWNRPEETKNAFLEIDGEKWLRTGDLVRMDNDGFVYFYDRLKDVIKYKGLQVFARQVEEVLKEHPKVKEVGVVGIPDPRVGENVKAFIVVEKEARGQIAEQELMDYCEGKLTHYMIPRLIEFVGEIPLTDAGKVSRRELREEA